MLLTGGLGFIGSNLSRRLVDLGAEVIVVDSLLPDCGGNLFNLDGYERRLRVDLADVRGHGMEYLMRNQELIFNLAGQVSHIDSMRDPLTAHSCSAGLDEPRPETASFCSPRRAPREAAGSRRRRGR